MMADTASPTLHRLGYKKTRALLLGGGLVILVIIAVVMYVRRVDTAEVGAALLFVPVFIAALLGGLRWGLAAGAAAAIGYVALRYPAIEKVGVGLFWGRIASRSIAYLVFGGFGGLFSSQLQSSLVKLELYDQVDDDTGLFNARFLVQDVDLEVSRAKRYNSVFSVALVDVPDEVFDGLQKKVRKSLLADLGKMIQDSVRTVDRGVYGGEPKMHRFAAVLPETGAEGARIFVERLAIRMEDHLTQNGARTPEGGLIASNFTFPGDDAEVQALRDSFAEIDRRQHPEAAES